MPPHPASPRLALAVITMLTLFLAAASPVKRGNISAYVRFEIANPVTSYDMLDAHPPALDPERMLKTEAARMIDDEALEEVAKERIVARDAQPPGVDELRAMLRAEVVPGTYFVDIVASASTESDALAVAGATADVYRERFSSHRGKIIRDRIQNVEQVTRDLSRDIEQIDARCEAIMAKEKLTRLSQTSETPKVIEARLLVEMIAAARLERKKQIASGVSADEMSVQDQVLADLETQLSAISLHMEFEAQALHQLQHWTDEREEKVRLTSEFQREMIRLRMIFAGQESAYPAIRMLNKPRIRATRGN